MQDIDAKIKEILSRSKVIAVVGLSPKPERESYEVASYLQRQGYRIVPVYPREETILGEKVYRDLKDIPFPVDIVDIFRKAEEVMPFVEDAVAIRAGAIWLQLGIENSMAQEYARAHGVDFIMDHCLKIEHRRAR